MYYRIIFMCSIFFALGACRKENSKMIGMPNPASVYCAQLHGKSTPVSTPQGEYAICTLPSGEKIEEWALFRRDHPQPSK